MIDASLDTIAQRLSTAFQKDPDDAANVLLDLARHRASLRQGAAEHFAQAVTQCLGEHPAQAWADDWAA